VHAEQARQEERRRIIEQERVRMIREHAIKLWGFLPKVRPLASPPSPLSCPTLLHPTRPLLFLIARVGSVSQGMNVCTDW